jgi:hypothetical protein
MTASDPRRILERMIEAERAAAPSEAVRAANWAGLRAQLGAAAAPATVAGGGLGKLLGALLTVGASATIVVAWPDGAPDRPPASRSSPASTSGHVSNDMSVSTSPPPTPADPRPDGWDAELQLLQKTQAALRAGRTAEALALVDEYERRWPKGVFIEEIQAARVLGLCAGGDRPAARRAAASFRGAWPQSLYLAQIQQRCADPSGRPGARRNAAAADTER